MSSTIDSTYIKFQDLDKFDLENEIAKIQTNGSYFVLVKNDYINANELASGKLTYENKNLIVNTTDFISALSSYIKDLTIKGLLSEDITAKRTIGGILKGKTYTKGLNVDVIISDLLSNIDLSDLGYTIYLNSSVPLTYSDADTIYPLPITKQSGNIVVKKLSFTIKLDLASSLASISYSTCGFYIQDKVNKNGSKKIYSQDCTTTNNEDGSVTITLEADDIFSASLEDSVNFDIFGFVGADMLYRTNVINISTLSKLSSSSSTTPLPVSSVVPTYVYETLTRLEDSSLTANYMTTSGNSYEYKPSTIQGIYWINSNKSYSLKYTDSYIYFMIPIAYCLNSNTNNKPNVYEFTTSPILGGVDGCFLNYKEVTYNNLQYLICELHISPFREGTDLTKYPLYIGKQ